MTRYATIVADPPWEYEKFMPSYTPSTGRVAHLPMPYPMLSVEAIAALPVRDLAERDCRLLKAGVSRKWPSLPRILSSAVRTGRR